MIPVTLASDVCRAFEARLDSIRLIDENPRHFVFSLAMPNGVRRFVKATRDPAERIQLENESRASLFIASMLYERDATALVPAGGDIPLTGGAYAIWQAFIEADWFASKKPKLHLTRGMYKSDLEDVFRVMAALHDVDESEVPSFFMDRAKREFTDADYRRRFDRYLVPVIEAGHVSRAQAEALAGIAFAEPVKRRFVHHDIVPWNLGRTDKGRLVLVDAEFARWGMAYYDVAYFFLQTHILLGDPKLAATALTHFVSEFQANGHPDVTRDIWAPLAYRLAANLGTANPETDELRRGLELIPSITSRNLGALML